MATYTECSHASLVSQYLVYIRVYPTLLLLLLLLLRTWDYIYSKGGGRSSPSARGMPLGFAQCVLGTFLALACETQLLALPLLSLLFDLLSRFGATRSHEASTDINRIYSSHQKHATLIMTKIAFVPYFPLSILTH